ncbi:MAG: hypothetical protein V3T23_09845 [Nitrososphaerales archaeon]
MFKYLMSEYGLWREVDINPKPTNLRERFALWIMTRYAPRLHVVEIQPAQEFNAKEAREEWSGRTKEWPKNREEDISILQLSVDEETGAFE